MWDFQRLNSVAAKLLYYCVCNVWVINLIAGVLRDSGRESFCSLNSIKKKICLETDSKVFRVSLWKFLSFIAGKQNSLNKQRKRSFISEGEGEKRDGNRKRPPKNITFY